MNSYGENKSTNNFYSTNGFNLELLGLLISKPHYHVHHGFFKWSIENYSFPVVHDKYVLSPTFKMHQTWWYLTLHPRTKLFGQDKISLNLFRHKSDLGPETAIVSYRIGLESGDNKIWFKPEESITFGKGDSYGFQTSILGHLEDFLIEDEKNKESITLSVLCELYVKYEIKENLFVPNSQKSLIGSDLQLDFIKLHQATKNNYDILIEIPKWHARAHKAILCARSKTIARMLEDGKSFIQLLCTRSCLNCVLTYMYSGNFNYLAKTCVFSIGLYELACELSLFKLRDMLTPYKVELKSRIIIDKCKILCTLCELHSIDFKSVVNGDYFDASTGIGINLCVQKTDFTECLKFCFKISGILTALDFNFDLCVLNKNRESFAILSINLSQISDIALKDSIFTYNAYFARSDILNCCDINGNLYLILSCERRLLSHVSGPCADIKDQMLDPYDSCAWLEELSSEMRDLLRSSYLNDITLEISGKKFKAHRSVLAARSIHYRQMFQHDQHKNDVIVRSDFDSHIFELILTYIYSGRIDERCDLDKYDCLNLYKAAVEFGIMSLLEQCIKYLELNLDPVFVFDVLRSVENRNWLLESKCKIYIDEHDLGSARR